MKLFSAFRGFIARPTHNRPATLRQASRPFPERGSGGREDLARLPLYFRDADLHRVQALRDAHNPFVAADGGEPKCDGFLQGSRRDLDRVGDAVPVFNRDAA